MPSMTLTRTEMASFAFSIYSDGTDKELTGSVGAMRERSNCNSYGNVENWQNAGLKLISSRLTWSTNTNLSESFPSLRHGQVPIIPFSPWLPGGSIWNHSPWHTRQYLSSFLFPWPRCLVSETQFHY